jgi:Fur family transcriptional regulator, ferric uptake regulator
VPKTQIPEVRRCNKIAFEAWLCSNCHMKHYPDSPILVIESAIRAVGARVTPSRVRVLSLLQSAPGPLSHGDIEKQLCKDSLPDIDSVTLYRVLDWLADVGLAHKSADARGVFCFSAAKPNIEHAQHLHFRCTRCGSVVCLEEPLPPPPKLPEEFRLTSMRIDISGECPVCAQNPPHSPRRSRGQSALL